MAIRRIKIDRKNLIKTAGSIFRGRKVPSCYDYIEYDDEEYFTIESPQAKEVSKNKGMFFDRNSRQWVDF